jgi:hypothetical protein
MKTNRTEQKTLTKTHATTKLPKICIGVKIASSTNDVGKTGYPPMED